VSPWQGVKEYRRVLSFYDTLTEIMFRENQAICIYVMYKFETEDVC